MKRLIVTADDFGIAEEINAGIAEAHRRGIVTAVSLLANAPATEHAVGLARDLPELEVGIHLSIVEGISLRGRPGTLTDKRRYFSDALCLHRHWRQFIPRYALGMISLKELEEELTLQIERFLTFFPRIPFANGTQHLHVLPGVQDIIVKLAKRYGIGAVRVPSATRGAGRRFVSDRVLHSFGQKLRTKLDAAGIASADAMWGFHLSGRLGEAELASFLPSVPMGTTEVMTHPGFECPSLRRKLPWGYRDFRWQDELRAVTSPDVRGGLATHGISLARFADLAGATR